jgi:DNA-binding ferritin-like protein
VIVAFDAMLDAVIRGLRRVLEAAADDPITQDALATVAGNLERCAWMIRAHRCSPDPNKERLHE